MQTSAYDVGYYGKINGGVMDYKTMATYWKNEAKKEVYIYKTIKLMNKNKYFISFLLVLCSMTLYSQRDNYYTRNFWGFTNDVAYWDGVKYMCDGSPLKKFKNYMKVFEKEGQYLVLEFAARDYLKNYYISWIIKDSTLYLGEINFFGDGGTNEALLKDRENRDKKIEKLTKRKFITPPFEVDDEMKKYIHPKGVIKAVWFSGELNIKRFAGPEDYVEGIGEEKYDNEPFPCLIIEKGRVKEISYVTKMKRYISE